MASLMLMMCAAPVAMQREAPRCVIPLRRSAPMMRNACAQETLISASSELMQASYSLMARCSSF